MENQSVTVTRREDKRIWFAMRDLKRSNAHDPAFLYLQELGFEIFTPMKEVLASVRGTKRKVLRPWLQDLLFVRSTRTDLDPVVLKTPTLQYRYARGAGYQVPIVVPDRQMASFIAAAASNPNRPRFLTPEEISPAMIGRKVRIMDGPLEGCEGRLLKIRGAHVKRMIVEIPGLLAVSVEVNPEFIQLIPEEKQ